MENNKSVFNTLSLIDCSGYTEEKNGLTYLKWSRAWESVKKNYPDANFEIHENSEGFPFFESKFGIDVKVSVTINNLTHTMRLPVLDGANKAMKSEAYTYQSKYKGEQTVNAATTFDINTTIVRCLVKSICMHGLGIYIYHGEKVNTRLNEMVRDRILSLTDNGKDTASLTDILTDMGIRSSREIMNERDLKKLEGWLTYLEASK